MQKLQDQGKEKDQTGAAGVARGSEGEVKEGRAFICFSGHDGGWLRHVLVVMVTFWACQRGDPSCCRLRRPETLILRDLPRTWIHSRGDGSRGSGGWIRRPSSGNHRFLLFEVVRSSDVRSTNRPTDRPTAREYISPLPSRNLLSRGTWKIVNK